MLHATKQISSVLSFVRSCYTIQHFYTFKSSSNQTANSKLHTGLNMKIILQRIIEMKFKVFKMSLYILALFLIASPIPLGNIVMKAYSQDPLFDPNKYEPNTPDQSGDDDTGGGDLENDTSADDTFDFGSTDDFGSTGDFGSSDFSTDEFSSPDFSTDEFSTGLSNGSNLVTTLSNSTGDSINGQLAVSGNRVYVIWEDKTDGGNDVFFIRSDDGSTYGEPKKVNTAAGKSSNPSLAVSGNVVYVAWNQVTEAGANDIFVSTSLDNGNNFEEPKNLLVNSNEPIHPKLMVSKNITYVTWNQVTEAGANDIFVSSSLDNGNNFEEPFNISNNSGESINPQIFANNGNIYLVWNDNTIGGNNEVYFTKKSSNDSSFEKEINLSNNTGNSLNPKIYATLDNVNIVWEDSSPTNQSNQEILFARSNNSGLGFGKSINLSNNTGESLNPTITGSGPNIYVAWTDSTPGNNDLLFARSTNNGITFGNFTNLSNTTGDSYGQSLISSGTNVYLSWSDAEAGNGDTLFISSINNGDTFGTTKNLSNNQDKSTFPQISLIGDREIVLWRDDTVTNKGEIMITDKVSNAVDFTGGFATDQFATDQFPTEQFPSEQFPTEQFPSEQLPTEQFPPPGELPEDQFPTEQFPPPD